VVPKNLPHCFPINQYPPVDSLFRLRDCNRRVGGPNPSVCQSRSYYCRNCVESRYLWKSRFDCTDIVKCHGDFFLKERFCFQGWTISAVMSYLPAEGTLVFLLSGTTPILSHRRFSKIRSSTISPQKIHLHPQKRSCSPVNCS